jgi:uncharacterized protein (TIGR02001 family)
VDRDVRSGCQGSGLATELILPAATAATQPENRSDFMPNAALTCLSTSTLRGSAPGRDACTAAGRIQAMAAIALFGALAAPAQALEITANGGFMSEYIFRGISQSDSSANGGVDLTHGGFYLGTWGADVEQGLEVDLYGGYNGSFGDLSYGIGATGYFYTDDFDDDYREINLSLGYGIFSVSAAFGEYKNFDEPTQDYSFVAPRVDYKGFYGMAGFFGDDFDGEYYEVGYGSQFEPIGLDFQFSIIYSTDELIGEDSGDTSLVLSVSKTFELFKN